MDFGWNQMTTGLTGGLQTGLQLGLLRQKLGLEERARQVEQQKMAEQEKQNRVKNAFEGLKTYVPLLQSPSETIRNSAMEGLIGIAQTTGKDIGWSDKAIQTIAQAGWQDDYLQPIKNIAKITKEFEAGTYGQGPQAEKIYMMGLNGELAKVYDHAQRKQIQTDAQSTLTRTREYGAASATGQVATRNAPGNLEPGQASAEVSPEQIETLALGGGKFTEMAQKFTESTIPEAPKTPEKILIVQNLIRMGKSEDEALRAAGLKPSDQIMITIEGQPVTVDAEKAISLLKEPKETINDFNIFYRSKLDELTKQYPDRPKSEIEGMISQEWNKILDLRAKSSGEARGEAFAATRGMQVYDKETDETRPATWKEISANPGRFIGTQDPSFVEKVSQARQRGGAITANVVAASKMYNQEAPELIAIRNRVHKKGLLPATELKDMEAINQWLGMKTSDPDVVLLKKKTKFLADSLMRVMGGSQGGEWAFKVAADILDPTLAPDAFATVVKSHGIAMERMGRARQTFGKEPAPAPAEPPPASSKPKTAEDFWKAKRKR